MTDKQENSNRLHALAEFLQSFLLGEGFRAAIALEVYSRD
jgi:hypothetical protein